MIRRPPRSPLFPYTPLFRSRRADCRRPPAAAVSEPGEEDEPEQREEDLRARLLQQRVAAPARGAASVAVDFSLSLFAQILFTLLGFVLLARLGDRSGWWPAAVSAALVPAFALLSWELLVRRRLLVAAERGAARLGQHRLPAALETLGAAPRLFAPTRGGRPLGPSRPLARFCGPAWRVLLALLLV